MQATDRQEVVQYITHNFRSQHKEASHLAMTTTVKKIYKYVRLSWQYLLFMYLAPITYIVLYFLKTINNVLSLYPQFCLQLSS